MRKRLLGLTVFILAMCMTFFYSNMSKAATVDGNDDPSVASAMDTNVKTEGVISDSKDVDWYKFSIGAAGKVSVRIQHPTNADASSNWKVDLYSYDENTGKLSEAYVKTVSSLGNVAVIVSDNVGLPSGNYYIRVTSGYNTSASTYGITANYQASDVWETEVNDGYDVADLIKVNTEIYGATQSGSDVDSYKFTTTSQGRVQLVFAHAYSDVDWSHWRVGLYTYDLQTGKETLLTSISPFGNILKTSTYEMGLPAGTYYVKIETGFSSSTMDYSFHVATKSTIFSESELNNSYTLADLMALGSSYVGQLSKSDDIDWYAVTIPATANYRLSFSHNYIDEDWSCWQVGLYRMNGAENLLLQIKPFGNALFTSGVKTLTAGTYYIKVEDGFGYSALDYKIALTKVVEVAPGKVVGLAGKNGTTKTMTASWSKLAGATTYQVMYATNSAFTKNTKVLETAKNKVSVSKLKKKTTYYVKVRGYKKVGITKLYGGWSSTIKVKIKK